VSVDGDGDGEVRLIRRMTPRSVESVAAPDRAPMMLHRVLPNYGETPLISLPAVAHELGLQSLHVKDDSHRIGLPSFKILGASWAVYCILSERLGAQLPEGSTIDQIAHAFAPLAPLTLVAATDGNHGRALAHITRLFGFQAHILVPVGMAQARIEAIEAEGAIVEVIDGSYDLAVERAAAMADERTVVVADTAWKGYEKVPTWISDGYSTIFWEIDDALTRTGQPQPDLVIVQIGVGALARSVVAHYRRLDLKQQPTIVGVEPISAACALETAAAGKPTYVPGPHPSVMAGLNAGMVSTVALPALLGAIDAFLAIPDSGARGAVRLLAKHSITAGETGAAGLGALMTCSDVALHATGVRPSHALVLVTEGVTDPISYAETLAAGSTKARP
jgi:diaminopropionate ammonia-lyase